MYKFLSKKIDQPCSSNGVMREERRKREPSRDREREREREREKKQGKKRGVLVVVGGGWSASLPPALVLALSPLGLRCFNLFPT
jgi:hypothetical protein